MDMHLNKLATEMVRDSMTKHDHTMAQLFARTRQNDLSEFMPKSTALQPRDFKPSHVRFKRVWSATNTSALPRHSSKKYVGGSFKSKSPLRGVA